MMTKVIESLNEATQRDRLGIELCNLIVSYMKAHEGQKITKRIATSMQETLRTLYGSEVTVNYSTDYSWYALKVWGGVFGRFDSHFSFTIGYFSHSPNYDSQHFMDKNTCYGQPAKDRIAKRTEFINDAALQEQIISQIDAYHAAQEQLKKTFQDLEASYTIQKVYGIDLK
jgi:hypothetical protein